MTNFHRIQKEISEALTSKSKEELLEEYLAEWRDVLKEQQKYPNRKSKKYKDLDKKAKHLQQKVFAVRTSQANDARGF